MAPRKRARTRTASTVLAPTPAPNPESNPEPVPEIAPETAPETVPETTPETTHETADEEDECCCFCLEPMQSEGFLAGTTRLRMICCGKELCTTCDARWEASEMGTSRGCPYCRAALPVTDHDKLVLFRAKAVEHKSWALLALGDISCDGIYGVDQDFQEAARMYRLATEQDMRLGGGADAAFGLGALYFEGDGVERDIDVAIHWFTKARETGNLWATWYLGRCYKEDSHLDKAKMFGLWLEAAQAGFPKAQTLGWCVTQGDGVQQNYAQAISWYGKACRQGDVLALVTLSAILYRRGEDGEELDEEGVGAALPTIMSLTRAAEPHLLEGPQLAYGRDMIEMISSRCASCSMHCSEQGHWCVTCQAAMYCSEQCMEDDCARHQRACENRNRFVPEPGTLSRMVWWRVSEFSDTHGKLKNVNSTAHARQYKSQKNSVNMRIFSNGMKRCRST